MSCGGFDLKSISARRRNQANPYFGRGQIIRHVLSLLREVPAPMTTREIVMLSCGHVAL